MKRYNIIVVERFETKFEIKADNEKEAKSLIYQFYNGFNEDTETDRAEEITNNLSVDFLDWNIDSINEIK